MKDIAAAADAEVAFYNQVTESGAAQVAAAERGRDEGSRVVVHDTPAAV
jgi:hypothetical protein